MGRYYDYHSSVTLEDRTVTATFSACQGESYRPPVHTLPFCPSAEQQPGTSRSRSGVRQIQGQGGKNQRCNSHHRLPFQAPHIFHGVGSDMLVALLSTRKAEIKVRFLSHPNTILASQLEVVLLQCKRHMKKLAKCWSLIL